MASMVVDHRIGIIVSALQSEASLLGGIHNELKNELESMKAFRVDAERKQLKMEGEKTDSSLFIKEDDTVGIAGEMANGGRIAAKLCFCGWNARYPTLMPCLASCMH
ncbi:conserved hypothetical protein [Ricinus communis]|uniref:Uncharacterized protein n=1 Tax=Ricinus communis TaxID=3988 RepID=B9SHP8_RICCO|nr:conserved hypothetical protein [Ricinus communis]